MSKEIPVQRINSCAKCDYFSGAGIRNYCMRTKEPTCESRDRIPSWCPLKDAPNHIVDTNKKVDKPKNPYPKTFIAIATGDTEIDYPAHTIWQEGFDARDKWQPKAEWKDKPDSEGWWWYRESDGNSTPALIGKNLVMHWNSNQPQPTTNFGGEWQKVIMPQEENK